MPTIGSNSKSFLRSDIYEISDIYNDSFLEKVMKKNRYGLIRSKKNILDIVMEKGIKYRMVFNAMNMRDYTEEEIKEELKGIRNELYEIGIGGIVEFHNADGTQNSDHIHLWINSNEKNIYNRIGKYMIDNGLSNEEDLHIQKYEVNGKIDNEFLYMENIKDDEELQEERREEVEKIDKLFLLKIAHEEGKKEDENKELSIRNLPEISIEERGHLQLDRDVLPKLPIVNMAGFDIEPDTNMLLPNIEEEQLHIDPSRDTLLRLQGTISGDVASKTNRKILNIKNKISILNKKIKGNILETESENNLTSFSLEGLDTLNEKTEKMYLELYGLDKKEKNIQSKEYEEEYKYIKKLRYENNEIMRQL